jgi:hypothetical protein
MVITSNKLSSNSSKVVENFTPLETALCFAFSFGSIPIQFQPDCLARFRKSPVPAPISNKFPLFGFSFVINATLFFNLYEKYNLHFHNRREVYLVKVEEMFLAIAIHHLKANRTIL